MKHPLSELKKISRRVRRSVIEMTTPVRSSHIGGSFSAADLLVALYFETLKIDSEKPADPERDIFLYSKGHSSAAFYAVLAERGFFPKKVLEDYYVDGGRLPGHPVRACVPGVEISSGSLGHGLPVGVGFAIAGKKDKNPGRIFVMISDGECDEGSVWEAAMFAGFRRLDNLVVIVDYNKIQSLGKTKEVLDLEPFADKWRSFNWAVSEVDGHDIEAVVRILQSVPFETGKPSVLIAHTVKGKGVSFMEDKLEWHYRSLDDPKEYARALREVDGL